LGRIGGEEFAVLLPETDEAGTIAFAERLLSDIRAARVITQRDVWTFGLGRAAPVFR
jgi:GGDEF domain-containing protein